ncbi:MAG: hypothetical protein PVI87_00755 [Gammaproteobacteria bacterium]|jgi:hypothetical protein
MRPIRCAGLAAAALLFLHGPPAAAFELLSVDSRRDGAAYELRIEARFRADAQQLLTVLTDYDRIHELHPRLLASRSLGPVAPGVEEVYVRLEGCVVVFCRTLHRVEQIRLEGGALIATDVPRRGSFREGRTEWRFRVEPQGTVLEYQTHFVPAFEPMPLLGPALLLEAVEQMTLETMAEVDRRALLDE